MSVEAEQHFANFAVSLLKQKVAAVTSRAKLAFRNGRAP
jgi:hypothetical protein